MPFYSSRFFDYFSFFLPFFLADIFFSFVVAFIRLSFIKFQHFFPLSILIFSGNHILSFLFLSFTVWQQPSEKTNIFFSVRYAAAMFDIRNVLDKKRIPLELWKYFFLACSILWNQEQLYVESFKVF